MNPEQTNIECETPPSIEEKEEDSVDSDNTLIETRNIEVSFGALEVFKERTKYVEFQRPMTDEDITYTIKKSALPRTIIKSSFELEHHKGELKPNQNFRLGITYKPTVVGIEDTAVYQYTDSDDELIRITLNGIAKGPSCRISVDKLEFYIIPDRKITQRKLEVNNTSSATAFFKIDIAPNDIFNIFPTEGIITPNKHGHITIKFCPRRTGFFARKLFILIWNATPLIVELLGINGVDVDLSNTPLTYLNQCSYGLKAYLEDQNKAKHPFEIHPQYLNFGSVMVNETEPLKKVTMFTNRLNRSIFMDWNLDTKSSIFTVKPKNAKINSNKTATFEVQFKPEICDSVYQETMMAQIYWKPERKSTIEELPVPSTCNLRVQGYSFPKNEIWISYIKVLPKAVHWQPCSPGEVVFTTFLLQNCTDLPVLYSLIPPLKTNIIAKPMMGKFRKNEIIAVQLETEKDTVRTYIEEWTIVLNDRDDQRLEIYFHGETCIPIIEIGDKNKINAGNVQDGSQKEIEVLMQNKSFNRINFRFSLIKQTILRLEPMSGILPVNQLSTLKITIIGSECAPKKETFVCETRFINSDGSISEVSHNIDVDLHCQISFSELCACPSFKDCGRYPFGHKLKVNFEVINLGETTIFFQMCQTGDESADDNFRIKPYYGEVIPKEAKHIIVTGIISKVGNQTVEFGYYNRMVRDSPFVTGVSKKIFHLTYQSELPIIQIEQIVEHNFGELFGKLDLYKHYLEIPRTNQILREIQNDQTVQIHLRFPDFQVQEKEFYIKLALTNISDFDVKVNLKRKKICDCELTEISTGAISKRKKGFSCPHRLCLSMDFESTQFPAKTTRFLSIKVNYQMLEDIELCYVLELSCRRVIEFYFKIPVILPDTPKLSTYTRDFSFSLEHVYLGTRVAPIQIFWLRNNTQNLLHYKFNTKNIEQMCRINGFPVLEILNPCDQIYPNKNKALLVRFLPIESKSYFVTINVEYYFPSRNTSGWSKFLILGNGVMEQEFQSSEIETMPKVCNFIGNFPATLSVDYIDANIIPTFSRKKELIFITNNSRDRILQCEWITVKIDDLIEISARPNSFRLLPNDVLPVEIIITSFSQPCRAKFVLPCKLMYYLDIVDSDAACLKKEEINTEGVIMEACRSRQQMYIEKVRLKQEYCEYASVTISIQMVHSKDLDESMNMFKQLKRYPNQCFGLALEFPIRDSSGPDIRERKLFGEIIEDIISDALFGSSLKNLLEKSIKTPMNTYNDFTIDDKANAPSTSEGIEFYRKRETENFFNQLKLTEQSDILEGVIFDSIKQIFESNKKKNDLDIDERI
ncbi:unnamed protein product [Ceutorhynchus assimilis]|uniref:SWIM-type domain-containing protein n=1 Tax=Ceutorhynchus assimilis TaxID=467358 RepID=A0A9N9QLW9_9CUCU|nr:unnamed protein product [Ceutorhynchus assimilis]